MFSSLTARQWSRQLFVVLGYGLAYSVLHDVVLSQYSLSFGFRLAVLAVTPYRYWAALVLGEALSSGYIAITCMADYGATWATLRAIPMIGLAMPIIYVCRERLGLLSKAQTTNVPILVLASLVAALVVAPFQVGLVFTVTHLSPRHPGHVATFFRDFLMNYAGALTIAPLMLCIREVVAHGRTWAWQRNAARWRVLLAGVVGFFAVLAVLTWIGTHIAVDSEMRTVVQIAMFIPVVAMALRYGWYGAAIGGAVAGIAVEALMAGPYDHSGMQAQTLIAFAISTMLLMGKHITVLSQREQHERMNLRLALATAQQNLQVGEQRFGRVAATLWDLQASLFRALQFGRYMTTAEGLKYDQQTRLAIGQLEGLAQHLRPVPVIDRHLPSALRKGAIARTLETHCVEFHAEFVGGISGLPAEMQLVLFRLITDGVVQICDWQPVSKIVVSVRARRTHGRLWILVQIDGLHVANQAAAFRSWPKLLAQLEQHVTTHPFEAIESTVHSFEGRVRVRPLSQQTRLSALLAQPSAASKSSH